MNYSEKMKEIRMNKNLKQNDIAELLGIKRSTYKDYELQTTVIPIKHLINFCDLMNISIDYLLDLSCSKIYSDFKKGTYNIEAGKRLRNFRKEKKLTQSKLAEILNTTFSTIAFYEKGRNLISTSFLYTICKKYNMSADYLLGKIDYIPDWCKN